MEHFTQTNVFARIWTVLAHLIIGCAIQYPKFGNLRYCTKKMATESYVPHNALKYALYEKN